MKNKSRQQSNQQSQDKTAQQLQKRVDATLKRLESKDPGLKKVLQKAYGYAVFPSVGKAALVVGGSYGRGGVFEKEKFIGYATISQMTIGVQVGGDTFSEILIFHDKNSLKRFKQGRMAFAANASAVLVKAAAAGTNNFGGVTALAYSSGGMLLELSLGGQKFKFKPLGEGPDDQQDGKGAKAKGRASDEEDEEGDESDQDEQDDEGEDSGMLGRAIDGVKGAASKVTDLAKERPLAATLVGAGLVTGLALLAMRAFGQSDDDESEDHEDDDDDTEARGSDESEEEQEESDEEEDGSEEEEDEDEESSNNHVGGRRSHRFR